MGSRKHTLAHNREKQMFCVYNEKVCLKNEIVLLLPQKMFHTCIQTVDEWIANANIFATGILCRNF